ncbi:MAG TPA: type II CAAX endopeptidase family protein [Myxococcaceae bacterium]|nr:type II CAAX endopeptidase family protein [Myxococcaceae bacterium]
MFSRFRQLVRAHPVTAFYALAFPLSWRAYLVGLFHAGGEKGLDPYGPLVAAVIVTALAGGLDGLKTWARTLLRWRAAPSLYAFALLFPLLITLLGIAANVALGARPPPPETWAGWPSLLVVFPLVMVLGGPLGEEPAWRGLALARVAERRPMLQASLAVGVVWFAWHLPLLLARPGEVLPGAIGILSASVVFGWLYQRSSGVVLLPLLMHTAQNTFGGEFAGPMFSGADVTRLSWLRGALYLLTAGVLVLRDARLRGTPVTQPPELAAPRIAA